MTTVASWRSRVGRTKASRSAGRSSRSRRPSRAAAPLRKAENAVTVDTSKLNFEESFEKLCGIISSRLHIERLSEKE